MQGNVDQCWGPMDSAPIGGSVFDERAVDSRESPVNTSIVSGCLVILYDGAFDLGITIDASTIRSCNVCFDQTIINVDFIDSEKVDATPLTIGTVIRNATIVNVLAT